MNFDVLFSAVQPIPIHAVFAIAAVALGGLQFALPKGTPLHRFMGFSWVVLMLIVAVTSFLINEFRWVGPFGPIHILSVLVLHSLWHGLISARRGDIQAHRKTMVQLYMLGLILAGAFTFAQGRIMHSVLFG